MYYLESHLLFKRYNRSNLTINDCVKSNFPENHSICAFLKRGAIHMQDFGD